MILLQPTFFTDLEVERLAKLKTERLARLEAERLAKPKKSNSKLTNIQIWALKRFEETGSLAPSCLGSTSIKKDCQIIFDWYEPAAKKKAMFTPNIY
ncbi:hypothetical protein [Bathymodiolus septemdierum thioautotrophic gill symbiont]|uniref:Uncharacterized protein n=1 Tax=endosymbiont of Bathymodiolus septemdierum str. Myojin knoll TaxID=1303921 RepID=A0A0P0US35_9GAMM|nr:hypothetical protein [Bathymodiolus septemdierum thioautotrophic gill symbiont]BAS68078.1 hypothetical protein BSEPE_1089 [endosymbiont of Bathymodiolus septemdierum str. Myojin knoll]